jgi:murein DD-endopeptidase MepM/ murein hydrolase activator NlpD
MMNLRRSTADGYPVMNFPDTVETIDFSNGYDSGRMMSFIRAGRWGIGGYLEKRSEMYTAPQYENKRNIHMGVDIWAPANEPVFSPVPGRIAYKAFHNQPGNYGGTLVVEHKLHGKPLFALYGHVSKSSVDVAELGKIVEAGERITELGEWSENGNWPPHLHLQLSITDPGVADMPGVVAQDQLEKAKTDHPDPKILIGNWYS